MLKFIDLFAGIGGIHIAFEKSGATCVFASEWDKHARATYEFNFSKTNKHLFNWDESGDEPVQKMFAGDITKVTENLREGINDIPAFDVLAAGFPCQPFSQAGLRKGMEEARGTLFFDILQILASKKASGKPAKAFFLENVQGLLRHKSGDKYTIDIIEENLRSLGYSFDVYKVRASDFGVPQHRPRLFMIGFLDPKAKSRFVEPKKIKLDKLKLGQILGGHVDREIGWTLRVGGRGSGLEDRRNWDTYEVDGEPKRIEWPEGLKLQGFPSSFKFPDSVPSSQRMKQLGNSVAVPAVMAYAKALVAALEG